MSRIAGTGQREIGGATTHPSPAVLSVFWVQVLLAGLVVLLLLGAVLTYTYRRGQTCKPKVASKYRRVCTRFRGKPTHP